MVKVVIDADGLIKLVKSGIFPIPYQCIIAEEVRQETVVEGKKKLFEDAFYIENMIKGGNIKVVHAPKPSTEGLGKGEQASLSLFKEINADAIISDDRRFLNHLEKESISFITPAECIVRLAEARKITREQGKAALEKIKTLIRKESFDSAMDALGGKR